jgi:acyl dehydratase
MMPSRNPFPRIMAGDAVPPLTVTIDRLALIKYAGAADDYVREHWDHPYVVAKGYPDVIVHGWLTYAHMCRAVTDWISPRLATFVRYGVRYHRPLHPGTLVCGGRVVQVSDDAIELALWGRNGAGEQVATGTAMLRITGEAE